MKSNIQLLDFWKQCMMAGLTNPRVSPAVGETVKQAKIICTQPRKNSNVEPENILEETKEKEENTILSMEAVARSCKNS